MARPERGLQGLAIRLIQSYQRRISKHLPARCRFYPTCSAYGIEAIRLHGLWKGGLLSLWRFLRCNPLSAGGVDPVPGSSMERRRKQEAEES